MAKLTVKKGDNIQILNAKIGDTVFETLVKNGVAIHSPCGGAKLCKKCKIIAVYGLSPMENNESEFISDSSLTKGERLACHAKIAGDSEIILPADSDILAETSFLFDNTVNTDNKKGYGFAVDIGTTTVAMFLYDLENGQQIDVASAQNSQFPLGDDVISRINFTKQTDGLKLLNGYIVNQLNGMLSSLCSKNRISKKDIVFGTVSANTTMLHLLTGLNPLPLAVAPFVPESLFGTQFRASQLGLDYMGEVLLLPCVSAYIGGDITSGITACNLDETEQTVLYIDVGTNGEMVLARNNKLFCCSTAAGPAFEGAHISCGKAGVESAVNAVKQINGTIELTTIGNKPPVGICGSGLIDAIALMLENKVLEDSGFLEEDYYLSDNIYITPRDIREVQLAKSAICAGVMRLLEIANCTPNDVDKLLLAGGFGTSINPASAAKIGLFPKELQDKCIPVGNAAGKGACCALLSEKFTQRCFDVADRMEYIELSEDAQFTDLFVENMSFEG